MDSTPLQTNYLQHDAEYQRRREQGFPGWDSPKALNENLQLLAQVFQAPHIPQGGKLLELGCGAGDLALWAAEHGYEVTGVDISPAAISWANEKASQRGLQALFQVGDVCQLQEIGSDSFYTILDGRCFHCIIGPDRSRFLQEAYRLLKPGGIFLIATMCGLPTSEEYLKEFDSDSRCMVRDGVAVRYLGQPESIESEVTQAGFIVMKRRLIPRRDEKELDLLLLDVTKIGEAKQ